MKYCNNKIFIFCERPEVTNELSSILSKKYPPTKNNLIVAESTISDAKKRIDTEYKKSIYFDVIILDIQIPLTDRIAFIKKIKSLQKHFDLIFLSSSTKLNSPDKKFFKENSGILLPEISEDILFPLLEIIIEKKFNQKKLDLISKIGSIFNLNLRSHQILNKIVSITLEYLDLKICSITLVDREENRIKIGALKGFGDFEAEYRNSCIIKLSDRAVMTECIRKKKQVQYSNVLNDDCPFKCKGIAQKVGLKSILVTPILDHENNVLGTLNVYTKFEHKFQSDELDLTRLIALKASAALSSKKLFKEEQEEKQQQLGLILKIAADINKNVEDHKKVFHTIVVDGLQIVNADKGCIKICHKDAISCEYQWNCENKQCTHIKYGKPDLTNYLLQNRNSKIINDIDSLSEVDLKEKSGHLKSILAVPLISKNEIVGLLTAEHHKSNFFSEKHLRLFEALAEHAVIAIKNSMRYKAQQKRLNAQMIIKELIEETSQRVASGHFAMSEKRKAKKLDNIIKNILVNAGEIFHAQSGFIVLADFRSNYAYLKNESWEFGLKDAELPPLEIGVVQGNDVIFREKSCIVGKVIADGHFYNCTDVNHDRYYRHYEKNDWTKSEIVLPLKFQNQTFGALALDSYRLNAFSEEDEDILSSIAYQMALLIKRSHYLDKLLDLNKPFKNIDSHDKLYTEIVNRTTVTLSTQVCYIRTIDRDKLKIRSFTGINQSQTDLPIKIGEGVSGKVASSLEQYIDENIQKPESSYLYKEFARANQLFAMISVPIITTGRRGGKDLIGTLTTYANRICNFTSLDLQLMLLIADKAGEAIKKAKMFEQLDAISNIDEELVTTSERDVLQKIADIALKLLDADSVVLFQYNSKIEKDFGFTLPPIASGKFLTKDPKLISEIREDSFAVILLKERGNDYFINYQEPNKIFEKLYNKKYSPPGKIKFYQYEDLTSSIILKLKYKKEVVGILFINYRYKKSLSVENKKIARTFANKAAIAISNIRKYEDIDRLNDIGAEIVSESRLDDVLERIAQNAFMTLRADILTLYKYDNIKNRTVHPPIVMGEIDNKKVMGGPFRQGDVQFRIIQKSKDIFAANAKRHNIFGSGEKLADRGWDQRFVDRENINSCAAILLKVRNELVGLMFINYHTKQIFDSNQKRIIKIFANQAAIAIRNANLLDERLKTIKRISSGLTAIQKTGHTIVERLNKVKVSRHDILKPILDQALKLTGVEMGYIGVVNREQKNTQILVCSTRYKKLKYKSFGLYYPKQDWILKKRPYKVYNDIDAFADYKRLCEYSELNFEGDRNVKSALLVPIYSDETLLGKIILESEEVDKFTIYDALTLVSLSNQASMALQNFNLIHQLRKLREVDAAILKKALKLDDVLQIILKAALDLVKKNHGDISLLDDDRKTLRIKKSIPDSSKDQTLIVEESICGIAVINKKTFYERDVQNNNKFVKIRGAEKTRSELSIPLMVDDNPIGVLNIESNEIDDFTKEDIKILEMLAGQAAIAIFNAQLFEEIEKAKESLENSIDKSVFVGFTQMHGIFEHQINNYVGAIRLRAKDLLNSKDITNAKIRYNLERILESSERALNSPNEATAKANDLIISEKEKIDFSRISNDILHSNEFKQYKNIKVKLINFYMLPTIEASYNLLFEGVFAELIRNAIKAMPDGGQISIFGKKLNSKHIQITVTDTGCGIPRGSEKDIFKQGFSRWEKVKGKGQGLFYLKSIINYMGGDITFEPNEPKGTKFILLLPIVSK